MSQEAPRKQYPAIAMATRGCARSELVPSVRSPAALGPTALEHQSSSQLPGKGVILTASLEDQALRVFF